MCLDTRHDSQTIFYAFSQLVVFVGFDSFIYSLFSLPQGHSEKRIGPEDNTHVMTSERLGTNQCVYVDFSENGSRCCFHCVARGEGQASGCTAACRQTFTATVPSTCPGYPPLRCTRAPCNCSARLNRFTQSDVCQMLLVDTGDREQLTFPGPRLCFCRRKLRTAYRGLHDLQKIQLLAPLALGDLTPPSSTPFR